MGKEEERFLEECKGRRWSLEDWKSKALKLSNARRGGVGGSVQESGVENPDST